MVNLIVFIPLQKAGNLCLGEMLGPSNGLGATLSLHFRAAETLWSHYNAARVCCPKGKGCYNTLHL